MLIAPTVMDMEHLARVVRGYITEYNNMNKKPMHYLTAFKHMMRSISKHLIVNLIVQFNSIDFLEIII